MFAVADAEALLQASIQAFCTSIQSLWVGQLLNWLGACIVLDRKACGSGRLHVRAPSSNSEILCRN